MRMDQAQLALARSRSAIEIAVLKTSFVEHSHSTSDSTLTEGRQSSTHTHCDHTRGAPSAVPVLARCFLSSANLVTSRA